MPSAASLVLPQACDDSTSEDDGGGQKRGLISLQFWSSIEDKTELAWDAIINEVNNVIKMKKSVSCKYVFSNN
jgi:hypothetical protein